MKLLAAAVLVATGCSSSVDGDGSGGTTSSSGSSTSGGAASDGGGGATSTSTSTATSMGGGGGSAVDCETITDAASCEAADISPASCVWVEMFALADAGCEWGRPTGTCILQGAVNTGLCEELCPGEGDVERRIFYRESANGFDVFERSDCNSGLDFTSGDWSLCTTSVSDPAFCACACGA